MTYAYWKGERHRDHAVFDLFFRKNPFNGAFTVFAGVEECVRFVQSFRFSPRDIAYLKTLLPDCEEAFFAWLATLDGSELAVYAVAEGTVVFPRTPLIRVEGPLAVAQLVETTLLNLTNFASLICTNAARFRLAAGADKTLLEFGLRRAQGPDGAMSASRYSFMGGFDGTSNVAAGLHFGIRPRGTHAHSLVSAFVRLDDLKTRMIRCAPRRPAEAGAASEPPAGAAGTAAPPPEERDFVALALRFKLELGFEIASMGEMAAFISFAQAFPRNFLALVDTYDTLQSGVPNFICVALALRECGYTAAGVRLDSGDLAYLSKETRRLFIETDARYGSELAKCNIVASNDINESVLHALNDQSHCIDTFGIGTNLVTCQAQPALGMVYKLVEIKGEPRIKLSQDASKITIPGRKEAYRLIGAEGVPILDLVIRVGEMRPEPRKRTLCRHPFEEKLRAYVTPSHVIPLLRLVWKGKRARLDGYVEGEEEGAAAAAAAGAERPHNMRVVFPPLAELRAFVAAQLALVREDHLRPLNPTPYKVSVSTELYHYIHEMWMKEIPVSELS